MVFKKHVSVTAPPRQGEQTAQETNRMYVNGLGMHPFPTRVARTASQNSRGGGRTTNIFEAGGGYTELIKTNCIKLWLD